MTHTTTTDVTVVKEITLAPTGGWIDRHNGAYDVDFAVLRQVCDFGYCTEEAVGILVRGWECRPMCKAHGDWASQPGRTVTATFVVA